jgi:DNA-3-methyladenine glycosylase II
MNPEAHQYLTQVDPVMGQLIASLEPCTLKPVPQRSPFESLVRAVAHQQLHGKAAENILNRFIALVPGRRFPRPEDVLALSFDSLRAAGFSGAKIAALQDIARQTQAGIVPSARKLHSLTDDEIIERLTQCRGIGRWSVEMLLIFKLARPDVLPVDDFGIRDGYRASFGLQSVAGLSLPRTSADQSFSMDLLARGMKKGQMVVTHARITGPGEL